MLVTFPKSLLFSAITSLTIPPTAASSARSRIAQAPDEVTIEERTVPKRREPTLLNIVGMKGER